MLYGKFWTVWEIQIAYLLIGDGMLYFREIIGKVTRVCSIAFLGIC